MLEALVLALVAALFGACSGAMVLIYGSKGERARFQAELGPLRTELDDLEDRLDQWRKRDIKRARDERGAGAPRSPRNDDQPSLEGFIPGTRAERMAALRARAGGRWASGPR